MSRLWTLQSSLQHTYLLQSGVHVPQEFLTMLILKNWPFGHLDQMQGIGYLQKCHACHLGYHMCHKVESWTPQCWGRPQWPGGAGGGQGTHLSHVQAASSADCGWAPTGSHRSLSLWSGSSWFSRSFSISGLPLLRRHSLSGSQLNPWVFIRAFPWQSLNSKFWLSRIWGYNIPCLEFYCYSSFLYLVSSNTGNHKRTQEEIQTVSFTSLWLLFLQDLDLKFWYFCRLIPIFACLGLVRPL